MSDRLNSRSESKIWLIVHFLLMPFRWLIRLIELILKPIGRVLDVVDPIVRRIMGTVLAAIFTFVISVVFVSLAAYHYRLFLSPDTAGWIVFVAGTALVIFGTIAGALIGLIWPGPFIRIFEVISKWLPDIGMDAD